MHLGEEALQRVLSGSAIARIVNIWRPLVGPVIDQPLSTADFRSIDVQRDFGQTAAAPPGCRTGESQMVRYHPDQKWYTFSKMQTDECLLLKCFDSQTGVKSPHSVRIICTSPCMQPDLAMVGLRRSQGAIECRTALEYRGSYVVSY